MEIQWLTTPWPWYVAGPLIGIMVPLLLWLGNKPFGVSRSFKHICAATSPFKIKFFDYNWKDHLWNLFFVAGIFIGAFIAGEFMTDSSPVAISTSTVNDLKALGITQFEGLAPADIFNWENLFTFRGMFFMIVGGFLVGFGTRYAGGCTSGHSITGMANLQLSSLIATVCFFIGGLISTFFLLPLILR